MEKFDIGIIGGGPAGYTSAISYAKQGKSVILFEKDELGGTCLNRGCIPTKAFLHIADLYSEISTSSELGINVGDVSFDYKKVVEHKNNIVQKLRKGLELTLKNLGIVVIKEYGNPVDATTIKTQDSEYKCGKIIIATGSKPRQIKGLEYDHNFIISSDDILELTELPKSILIVGSGAIGIEWARILSAFGVEVTIVELMDRLCPLADWEVSKRLERQFKQKKIKTYLNTSVTGVENGEVQLSNNEVLNVDKVLVAVGRTPVTIENDHNHTVLGDASSEVMLAHYAISQAKEEACGIMFDRSIIPAVIYGTPEIAWIGEVSKSKEDDLNYNKHFMLISALGKSHCDDKTDGFIKILSKGNKIKGASIVSPESSAMIQQLAIAMTNGLDINDIKKVCFAHPTYSEGIMEVL